MQKSQSPSVSTAPASSDERRGSNLTSSEKVQRPAVPRIAIVHDFLLTWGGAERVLQDIAALYPEAPLYTLLADPKMVRTYFPGRSVRTSFLQKLPSFLRLRPHCLLPLYPVAVETLDFRNFDMVITSSGAWSKGIVTRLDTRHIAYLHSPMRFAWDTTQTYPGLRRGFFRKLFMSYLRLWDKEAAARPDVLLVNAPFTARRIAKYYRRDARVLTPAVHALPRPVVLTPAKDRRYFLIVSRLTAAKQIDLAVEVCNKLTLPLVIVGSGTEERALRAAAGATVRFTGTVDDQALGRLYSEARALIQPAIEDFGLAMVEALQHGTPVIARGVGSAREIIEAGVTGEFFDDPSPEVLADAVRRFLAHENGYDTEYIARAGERYRDTHFREELQAIVDSV